MTDQAGYTSNTTLEAIADRLRAVNTILISTHVKPDGDAIGSTLALARALMRLEKDVTVVHHGPWSHRFDPYLGDVEILHYEGQCDLPETEAIVIADTGAWSQLTRLKPHLEPRHDKTIVIDHHRHGSDCAALRFIEPEASAVCEPMARLCKLLLDVEKLPVDIAEPLYFGIATDTGWFRFNSVRPETFHLAAEFIAAGVDQSAIYRHIEQGDNVPSLILLRKALDSMELLNENGSALMLLTQENIKDAKADPDDTTGLIDVPQRVQSIRVVGLVVELRPDLTKISLRSKPGDQPGEPFVNVDLLAGVFGGGGHVHAAGAKVGKPVAEVLTELRELLNDPDEFIGLHQELTSRLEGEA
jgi:bifunctional oligoribonuclease and PAP phosphatase NrnA